MMEPTMSADYERALDVACPYCHAKPGEWCRLGPGPTDTLTVHTLRVEAAPELSI